MRGVNSNTHVIGSKRWQYRAEAARLREDPQYKQNNPELRGYLNMMVHCKLPNEAPQCCCTYAFQKAVLGETPEPVKYYDCSAENR